MPDFPSTEPMIVMVFTLGGNLAPGGNQSLEVVGPLPGRTITLEKAYGRVKTPSAGADIILDINRNGASIWNNGPNRLRILAGQQGGEQTAFNVSAINENDIETMDVDQVGSVTPGADLTLELTGRYSGA